MGTPYATVFDAFFSKVQDSLFLSMDKGEREIELTYLLNQAIPLFLYPKVDLDDRDDALEQFNVTLSSAEIQILSEIMKLRWLEQKINDENLLSQQFSDHDYRLTSQAAHLRGLLTLKRETQSLVRQMQHNYVKVKDRSPDFSGLAGGNNQ